MFDGRTGQVGTVSDRVGSGDWSRLSRPRDPGLGSKTSMALMIHIRPTSRRHLFGKVEGLFWSNGLLTSPPSGAPWDSTNRAVGSLKRSAKE